MNAVSLREFCRQRDWNPGYGHKLKAAGKLVMVKVGGKDLVDVDASLALLDSSRDPAKQHMADVNARQRALHRGETPAAAPAVAAAPAAPFFHSTAGGESQSRNATYNQAKTAREVYEAKLAQLKYETESGRLVNADEVRSAVARRAATLRESFLQLPSRVAALLAAETDQSRCHGLLETEIRNVLQQLADA